MSPDELLFFEPKPELLPIYIRLRERLTEACTEYGITVSKTQISFKNRYIFAMTSLPARRKKDWPKEYLMVSFGLNYEKRDPRIAVATEAAPNRWTHHVLLQTDQEVDDLLLSWLREAYDFSAPKGR